MSVKLPARVSVPLLKDGKLRHVIDSSYTIKQSLVNIRKRLGFGRRPHIGWR
jgi:hypothetical protein